LLVFSLVVYRPEKNYACSNAFEQAFFMALSPAGSAFEILMQ